MAKIQRAHITDPEILVWCRKKSGYSQAAIAKKISVKEESYEAWELGEVLPTIKQLRRFAHVVGRPIATFFLPEPPGDFDALRIKDYRTLPDEDRSERSPELLLVTRWAMDRREETIALYELLYDKRPTRFPVRSSRLDASITIADKLRDFLGVSIEQQCDWPSESRAYAQWRAALENKEVLVLQASGIEIGEMRGFSINDAVIPTIVVNSKDHYHGRIFTLFHELAHITLNEGALCNDLSCHGKGPHAQIEKFCNRIAAETLLPEEPFRNDSLVKSKNCGEPWSDKEIRQLSRRFSVSREVIVRRLLQLEFVSETFYQSKRQLYLREYAESDRKPKSIPIPMEARVVSRNGRLFSGLVLENYRERHITACDVSGYLGMRLKHLDNVSTEVFGA